MQVVLMLVLGMNQENIQVDFVLQFHETYLLQHRTYNGFLAGIHLMAAGTVDEAKTCEDLHSVAVLRIAQS